MWTSVSVCGYVLVHARVPRGHQIPWVWNYRQLWAVGANLRSSARAADTLNHRTISQALLKFLLSVQFFTPRTMYVLDWCLLSIRTIYVALVLNLSLKFDKFSRKIGEKAYGLFGFQARESSCTARGSSCLDPMHSSAIERKILKLASKMD